MKDNKKYLCRICGNILEIKNNLLFCPTCNIFIGKTETYKKAFDSNTPPNFRNTASKGQGDFSVMVSIYIALVLVVGVSIVLYIGFHSGLLLGELLCQDLQCI